MKDRLLASIVIALLIVSSIAAQAPRISYAATPVQENEPVTIRVMNWESGSEAFWLGTDKAFMEKYPWITVEHEIDPYGQYFDKVGAYIAAGDGPDLIQFETGMGILKYKDALVPINDYVKDVFQDINGTMAFCEDFDCSKNIYSLPHTNQAHMVYYNKTVFKEAGLDPEKPPTTWREFDDACQKIKAAGKECLAFGGKEQAALWTWCDLPQQTASLEEQLGLFHGTVKWTDAPFLNGWRLFEDMNKRGWFQQGAASTNVNPDSVDKFVRGDAAFYNSIISDCYNWKWFGDLMGGYENLGVMKFPKIECDFPLKGVCPGPLADLMDLHGGIGFGVMKWSKNPEAGVLYIKFVVSPETQKRFLSDSGGFPSNRNFDPSIVAAPQFQTIVKWANEAKNPPAILYATPEEWDEIIRQAQLILLGETDAQKAAEAVQATRDAALKK
jgi:multiple sugar transport system substrate-binding protein